MNSLDQTINLKVKITDLFDNSITATIYAFSASQEVLALKVHPANGPKKANSEDETFRIINTSFIKSLQVLSPYPKKTGKGIEAITRIKKVDIQQLESKFNVPTKEHTKPTEQKPRAALPGASHPKKNTPSPMAAKIFDKLLSRFGKENILWHGNDSILLFREVSVSKPYALNKISNSKKAQSSEHIEKIRTALREIWLEMDNSRRGG